ncbi:hypothetical protein [Pedobacter insulae]|uniref:Uncharacterized protein n=1 Tax=Pedobacter insulae TaxID=414048 RepID=A0A1I3ACZ9_9SPHI|nr:hypothetical protein [Pedobacter insulae]SFH47790.1 hypothetical protein SAMN04489864_1145 [Pedobacter insulae]
MPDTINTQAILDIFKYVGTFIIGGIVFLIKEKYTNRKSIFTKRTWGQRLAYSLQSQDWGNIQILYNGQTSNNLHIISAEIINTSHNDFARLMFEFSVPVGCMIYRHQGQLLYDDLTKDLSLEKDFNDKFEDVRTRHLIAFEGKQPINNSLQNEINFVTRHRRFDIPLIKGKTKAIFHFLVEDFEDNPYLNISILEPGIKVITYQDETERKEVKKKWTEYGGLIVFLVFVYPIYKYSNSVSSAIWLMIINLFFASFVSLGLYYFSLWVKKIL